ncbi:FMN-binding glutamate synthase family protein (plasmid) [Pontibacillus sp. ALD_SL1]|uniref:FMN-binding glutamate synthase family protein n=1 Tax=Pontibacillus sp. ALD_SL1 TaxID=2777185 RepID=UPI001A970333|nr:FMN-binding glutamate synthase family protein [Pontibacillus sp. ALD_SL1]QST02334.1 FMN-binding glutamate synthase family protein [Pontibacillus sp. ALD_SL1]
MLDMLTIMKWIPMALFYFVVGFLIVLFLKDKYQSQHSILKTHPLIGRLRYVFEMIGPELRQYWFSGDKENRPIDRDTQETIAKAGKYASTVIGFGSKKDFSKPDIYLSNSMFPKNTSELRVDNTAKTLTQVYEILNETLTQRKEKVKKTSIEPWHLAPQDTIVIGPNCPHPFRVTGLVGISAMSYGALSKSAVKALAQGVAISGGSFMNTGEGSISKYHLSKVYTINKDASFKALSPIEQKIFHYVERKPYKSNFKITQRFNLSDEEILSGLVQKGALQEKSADLIFQVGSGLYGARGEDGEYCEQTFLRNANKKEVKAIEIKLAQGAKTRGGKLNKEKITKEISEIRGVPMGKDIESPNRFPLFQDMEGLFDLIHHWRDITGKPVGIKVVAGNELSFEEMASYMKKTNRGPDYIAIDGGEGGTGATYAEMADSLGLPIYAGLSILQNTLLKYGVRDRVKIIASGMLATSDKMAIALSLGADLIYIARPAMNTIGCINAGKCHTNHCPTGVTSHLPHLEAGLVEQEKRFRTANYLTTMRKGLFMLGAACGIESPVLFDRHHITFHEGRTGKKGM